jgi:FkbM family methyltransferase
MGIGIKLRILYKPEYFYRPANLVKKIFSLFRPKSKRSLTVEILGQKFVVDPQETIGRALVDFGLYDLALTEAIWRLTKTGDRVVDVGANIGYFSLVMGYRVGSYGMVHCFEPHPALQKKWQQHLRKYAQCVLHPVALSSKEGQMDLYIPVDFNKNEGIASLEKTKNSKVVQVPVRTLDRVVLDKKIQLIKIDVEGHELEVLKGAEKVLSVTEYVVFEDFQHSKSPVIDFLNSRGFKVFRLYKGFRGLQILKVEEGENLPLWEPPNYIACRDEAEMRRLLSDSGWKCLQFL